MPRLIAVEYAKTVETELRFRFMRGLGTYLDTHSRIAHLLVYENRPHRLRSGGGWGRELTDHSFSLGNIGGLLRTTIRCNENPFVLEYIRRLELSIPWVEHLADDIQVIATQYRNGAAHTKPMERATLQQFRELLFSGELLQRLADLSKRVAAVSED